MLETEISLLETDNVHGQISVHIFGGNFRYCLVYYSAYWIQNISN